MNNKEVVITLLNEFGYVILYSTENQYAGRIIDPKTFDEDYSFSQNVFIIGPASEEENEKQRVFLSSKGIKLAKKHPNSRCYKVGFD